jgi:thiosulfate/3-mercaptopyruvate sulfurtransferase
MTRTASFHCVDVVGAQALIASGRAVVFDVRDAQSYGRGTLPTARNLSSHTLSEAIFTTPKILPVLISCYHGIASKQYAQMFVDFGFAEVYSLDGGYEAWAKADAAPAPVDGALADWLRAHRYGGTDVNAAGENGMTPLMRAAGQAEAEIVTALLAAGARIDARNADGNTALWLGCVSDDPDIVGLLLRAGADIDNRNDTGATCLMYAASSGKHRIVERLLAGGADVACETQDGFSALDMAASVECLYLLRAATAAASAAGDLNHSKSKG